MASVGHVLTSLGFFISAPGELAAPSPLLADFVDPSTGDYADLFAGIDPIDDQVVVALTTLRGSGGSVLSTGIKPPPLKIGDSIQAELTGLVKLALQRLIRARDIELVSVLFGYADASGNPSGLNDESNQAVQMTVRYRNLRTLDTKIRSTRITPRAAL